MILTIFANPKSDGASDSFGFRFSFHFGKPKFIIRRDLLLAIQKQIHTESVFMLHSTELVFRNS